MKILFAGPSLADDLPRLRGRHPGIRFDGPIRRGDLLRAVRGGATAVGIVDGLFRDTPPVWHKEILFALASGVAVAGGASMGALRAAECAPFGMAGVGAVFRQVAAGEAIDDGCVAQVHAPGPLGWRPLTEAWVTVEATIDALLDGSLVSADEAARLRAANRATPYGDRTMDRVAAAAGLSAGRNEAVAGALRTLRVDVKREDGLAVLGWLLARPDCRTAPPPGWVFAETGAWRAFLDEEDRSHAG